ncbi:MAG: hypothetical protein P1U58_18330 [Verrucomicrobiales bacterium]|nr:hypothetical protein [Verrucomicrobiales bacterium]
MNRQTDTRFYLSKRGMRALALVCALSTVPSAFAGLIINEMFRGNSTGDDYVEFLVTSDITLQELDGLWFGDSNFFTTAVNRENTFNAAEIITGSSFFSATTDTILAGSLIVAGGSNLAADFNYSPSVAATTDSDAWNLTLTSGSGITTTAGADPFDLGGFGDAVWVSESRPTSGSGTDDFISAVGYGWFQGAIGQEIEARELAGDEAFQVLNPGAEWDGVLNPNASLSNQAAGGGVDFAGSEGAPVTAGAHNGGANEDVTYDLRAVPEPSAILPCIFIAAFGIFLYWQNRGDSLEESTT